MENEPKGPYKYDGAYIMGPLSNSVPAVPYHPSPDHLAEALNAAYAEGYKSGRASMDRLKNVAKAVMIAMDIKKHRSPRGFFDMANPALEELDKALAEDEKQS
jgi:hypothetical protein